MTEKCATRVTLSGPEIEHYLNTADYRSHVDRKAVIQLGELFAGRYAKIDTEYTYINPLTGREGKSETLILTDRLVQVEKTFWLPRYEEVRVGHRDRES